ncbi:hypothetical protein QT969_22825, partial [Rhodococcus sp. CSLK01-03]
ADSALGCLGGGGVVADDRYVGSTPAHPVPGRRNLPGKADAMNVEEMARTLLTLDDEAALRSAAAIEDATFAAYASDYVEAMTRPGCKGCHGG